MESSILQELYIFILDSALKKHLYIHLVAFYCSISDDDEI